ncbi:MAG: hypothetical protein NTZ68_04250 [Candidatus Dependentiae bacterium]|nr:hypothetical protein [Candidatus Dependentiae bacterium]
MLKTVTKKASKAIAVPSQISMLIEAFNCDNEHAARLLVKKAMLVTHDSSNHWPKENAWNDNDLDAVISLIRGINPKDTIETILAAQFVSLHLKSMETMSRDNYNTMGAAMMMVRLSHQSLNMLQQYRGKSQTINVNYNVHSEGNTVLNSFVQAGVKEKMEGKS